MRQGESDASSNRKELIADYYTYLDILNEQVAVLAEMEGQIEDLAENWVNWIGWLQRWCQRKAAEYREERLVIKTRQAILRRELFLLEEGRLQEWHALRKGKKCSIKS